MRRRDGRAARLIYFPRLGLGDVTAVALFPCLRSASTRRFISLYRTLANWLVPYGWTRDPSRAGPHSDRSQTGVGYAEVGRDKPAWRPH